MGDAGGKKGKTGGAVERQSIGKLDSEKSDKNTVSLGSCGMKEEGAWALRDPIKPLQGGRKLERSHQRQVRKSGEQVRPLELR